jgi:ketosteroid isomerase-like protein
VRTTEVTATSIAEKFVDAINAHDVDGLTKLMSRDHVLLDRLGKKFPASALRSGWQQYFTMVPDYWVEVDQIASDGDVIFLIMGSVIGLEILASRTTTHFQMVESSEDKDGGRYRIRTYDFHRVKAKLISFTTI